MSREKISVIGGAGFVGTYLCQELRDKGLEFEIIDLKISTRFPEVSKIGDVRDLDSMRSTISGKTVVLLAAVHRDDVWDSSEYQLTNVVGAENVAEICRELDVQKIVFTSSVAVYGFATPGTSENGEINPFNEYGRSKFEAEERLRSWQKETGKSLFVVRPTVIFGEGNRGNVYNLLKQIASGRFVMFGKGENVKSIAYIGNVTAFLNKCINSKEIEGLYNYVDTPDMTMNTLVEQVRCQLFNKTGVGTRLPLWLGYGLGIAADFVARIFRRPLPVSLIRVKKFVSSTQFGSSKHNLDGFIAPFSLSEGLTRTLESEFKNPDPKREIFFTE